MIPPFKVKQTLKFENFPHRSHKPGVVFILLASGINNSKNGCGNTAKKIKNKIPHGIGQAVLGVAQKNLIHQKFANLPKSPDRH